MKKIYGFLTGKAGFIRFAVIILAALILLGGCPTGGTGSGNDIAGSKTNSDEDGGGSSSGGGGGSKGGSSDGSGNTGVTTKTGGTLDVNIGFNYGKITVTGSSGENIIYKTGTPNALSLKVSGYDKVAWYVTPARRP